MTIFIETILLLLIVSLCYICTKSDLDSGFIYNRVLFVFFIIAIVVDSIYYGFFVRDLFLNFIINVAIVSVVSLYLFYSHSFAGGDCKMIIVISLLFPARFYWDLGNSHATFIFFIAFAIFSGYIYLLLSSLWAIITKKVVITYDYVKKYLIDFLKAYIVTMIYISSINIFLSLLFKNLYINRWLIRIIYMGVAWCVGRYPIFKKRILLIITSCFFVIGSLVTGRVLLNFDLKNYALILIILLSKMTIKTTIYEEVKVSELKKGMILTTFSSILLQKSITKGLPAVSTEDLKSRLTVGEVESIKIWAKATKTENLTVVKKIPFAIFISTGVFLYGAMWGVLLWQ